MAIEKKKYFLGILPGKKEHALQNDVELRSPKLPLKDKTVGITVDSSDSLTYFKTGYSERIQREEINIKKPKVRHTLFSSYTYTWKKDV